MDKYPLISLVNENECKRIAEIGVLSGSTSRRLLTNCKSIQMLYMIDPWLTYEEIGQTDTTDKRLLEYTKDKWDSIFENAKKVAINFPERTRIERATSYDTSFIVSDISLDMIIIDGDHSYRSVRLDIIRWLGKIKDGGILSGHDYSGGWQSVVDSVNDTIGKDNITRLGSGYWYIQITPESRKMIYDKL